MRTINERIIANKRLIIFFAGSYLALLCMLSLEIYKHKPVIEVNGSLKEISYIYTRNDTTFIMTNGVEKTLSIKTKK